MELRVLQYFLAVAREQSILGASESLHLSQPTLSRQLKDLLISEFCLILPIYQNTIIFAFPKMTHGVF